MNKFEAWKVRRELWRIWHRARRKLINPDTERAWETLRGCIRPRRLDVHEGALSYGPKVAIFLLYQPGGLSGSAWFTLEHLCKSGWTPLVVSNAPLSDADLMQLKAHSVKIIARDNIGYDFGGYYEGVRRLRADDVSPDRVLILNDSSWFPLRENDDTLQRLEALDKDFAGHIYKVEDETATWRDHVESHLLMFSNNAWEHPEIRAFWANYVMTSDRAATIDRGERGITHAVLNAGLSIGTLWSREIALAWIESLTDEEVKAVLRGLTLHRDDYEEQIAAILQAAEGGEDQDWRQAFMDWTRFNLSNSLQILASAAYIVPAQKAGLINFMKKAREARYRFIEAVDAGEIAPLHPEVDKEIRERFESWKPEISWRTPPDGKVDMPRRYQHLS